MAIHGDILTYGGIQLLEASGHVEWKPFPQAHHRATILVLKDGRTVRVRTCNLPQLPMIFTADDARTGLIPDRLNTATGYDFMLAVTVKPGTSTAIIAFLIPSEVVRDYVLEQLRAGKKDLSPHLMAGRWAEYRLEGEIAAGAVRLPEGRGPKAKAAGALSAGGDDVDYEVPVATDGWYAMVSAATEKARRLICDETGAPPSAVHISIEY